MTYAWAIAQRPPRPRRNGPDRLDSPHVGRCAHRSEEQRVPCRPDAGRGPGAGARGPPGPRAVGGRRRLRRLGPGLPRRRRRAGRRRRRALGARRAGPQGQGAAAGGIRPPAPRPGPLHLPAPGRLPRVHAGDPGRRHDGDRLRDGHPRPLPAAAGPHEPGGRPPGPRRGRLPPPPAAGRLGRADGRRARHPPRPGGRDRRRGGRRGGGRDRRGHGRGRDRPGHLPRAARAAGRRPPGPDPHAGLVPPEHR